MGVQPDFIVCRSDHEVNDAVRAKIAHFCDVDVDSVLSCIDAPSIYEVPINLFEQEFDVKVLRRLKLPEGELHRAPLQDYVEDAAQCDGEVNIAVVGKYTSLPDAYLSVVEALHHAGVANGVTVNINLINGEELSEENVAEVLEGTDGILVPGGFGQRAFEGKIAAVRFARENGIPFLGICLGLHTERHRPRRRNISRVRRRRHSRTGWSFDAFRHRPHARTGGHRKQGRHHAFGRLSLQGCTWNTRL